MLSDIYTEDLAYVHDKGFGAFARNAAPALIARVRQFGITRGHVLDIGCGSGALTRAFVDAGFEVTGIDISPSMVALARGLVPQACFVTASLYDVALKPAAAIFAIGEALTYMGAHDPRHALPQFFARAHAALHPGGLFVFDVVLAAAGEPMHYDVANCGDDWTIAVEVREDPAQSIITRTMRISRTQNGVTRTSHETHRVRTFTLAGIEQWLANAGFTSEVLARYGRAELPPGRAAFLARKPFAV